MDEPDRRVIRTFRYVFWLLSFLLSALSIGSWYTNHPNTAIILILLGVLCNFAGMQFDRLDR